MIAGVAPMFGQLLHPTRTSASVTLSGTLSADFLGTVSSSLQSRNLCHLPAEQGQEVAGGV